MAATAGLESEESRADRGRRVAGRSPSEAKPTLPKLAVLVIAVTVAAILVGAGMVLLMEGSRPSNPPISGLGVSGLHELSPAQLSSLENASAHNLTVFSGNNSVFVSASHPTFLIQMAPSWYDQRFVVGGLVDPVLYLPTGMQIAITVVNIDLSMDHNWVLTTLAPPYGSMPMMGGGSGMMTGGTGMMGWGSSMMGPVQGGAYWSQQVTFVPGSTGHFWYLCSYPGHAAEGMYGSLVIG